MTEERIGGIEVEVSGNDSKLEATLDAAEQKIKAWVQRVSAEVSLSVASGATGPTRPAPAARPTPMRFGAGASGASKSSEQSAFERAINQELAKHGEALVDGEVVAIRQTTFKARRAAQQAVRQELSGPESVTEIPVTVDISEATKAISELVSEFRMLREEAAKPVSAPTPTPQPAAARGGGSTRARKPKGGAAETAASGEGAEVDPYSIQVQRNYSVTRAPRDPEVEANRREFVNRERMFWADVHAATDPVSTGRPSSAEQALLDALYPATNRGNDPRLEMLSRQAQEEAAGNAGRSATIAPTFAETGRTPEEAAAARRAQEEAARSNRGAGAEQRAREARNTPPAGEPYRDPTAQRAQERANAAAGVAQERREIADEIARRKAVLQSEIQEAQIERRLEQARATQQAQITAAGRTSRTTASTLAGFFGGPRRGQIEAQTELDAARQNTARATRTQGVFDRQIIRNEVEATRANRERAAQLRAYNEEIRRSPDYREAVEDTTRAIEREAAATQKLAKLSEGAGTAVKSLAAVTLGGAAFGLGLKAVDFVVSALGTSLGDVVDKLGGYGTLSTRITTDLGRQTQAQRGNADAVLANAEAVAGLSVEASDFLNTSLKLGTQIKAGAIAQQQASELFRGAGGVGNAPSGLFGGYGGLGNTALFGEQLGGGRGFTESLLKDVGTMSGRGGGPDLLGAFNQGLAYVTNPDVRGTVNTAAEQQGNMLPKVLGEIGKIISPTNSALAYVEGRANEGAPGRGSISRPTQSLTAYQNDLNKAAQRGAQALGDASTATLEFSSNSEEVAAAAQAAAQAGDVYGVTLAQQYGLVMRLNGAVVESGDAYQRAAQQFAIGRGIPDPAQLGRAAAAQERQRQIESRASLPALLEQQAFQRASIQGNIQRQFDFKTQTQIPASAALQNLANPPLPVGTGIVGRNAAEQKRIRDLTAETRDIQSELNDYYAGGLNILQETYKIPAPLLSSIQSVGAAIADTQAGIANQQAEYQVAQFNYQLHIARRSLSDIAGLTGKAVFGDASRLGILERENLLLGRQAQLMQFSLSQRQINFNTAMAGFTVPGLTPAEQNARVQEAKIEADFAQKQLNIQKEMFQNQVQIVDIGNLRQGYDLVKQISLLQQGREVTIDTAAAQQKLDRLQRKQSILVEQAGAYIEKTNAQVAAAMGEMAAIEATTGQAISKTMAQGILAAYSVGRAFFMGISGGFLGNSTAAPAGVGPGDNRERKMNAQGAVFSTTGTTDLGRYGWAGEAGDETVAILRNPRALTGQMGGGGGGATISFFGDMIFKTEADFQRLYRMLLDALGKDASIRGMRAPF